MKLKLLSISILAISINTLAYALPTYRGYSGAPSCNGTCASSCHGNSGGTIQVSGFPSEYIPGQSYTITISHNGGNSIRQFNGSCRIGAGSESAGTITSGQLTSTYSVSGEMNGVRLSSANQNTANFNWTAPEAGAGEVRLYIAGLQGSYSGNNTSIVLTSTEITTGIDDPIDLPDEVSLDGNYPNPFNAQTNISFSLPHDEHVTLTIYNIAGQLVDTILDSDMPAGKQNVIWDAEYCVSGIYVYRLQAGNNIESGSMTLLK